MNASNQSKQPDTDTIDRLFLELSQFTKATTGKELRLISALEKIRDGAANAQEIAKQALGVNSIQ